MPWLFILIIVVVLLIVIAILALSGLSYIERQEMYWLSQNGTLVQARIHTLYPLQPAASQRAQNEAEEELSGAPESPDAPETLASNAPPAPIMRQIIVAEWTDPLTEKTYVFRSHPLDQPPAPYQENDFVSVRIDPVRPQRYTFEVELNTYLQKHSFRPRD